MTLLLKDPGAALDYSVDWGAEYLGDDQLVQSDWSVEPDEPDGVSIAATAFDSSTSTVKAAGGQSGRLYRLVNTVLLASGRVDNRSIVLRVEKR
jgi:hypothetical protein